MEEARWYVVHTYSGYENKVKTSIETGIENRNLQDQIFAVMIPTQTVIEPDSKGVKKQVERKVIPGYVLVRMIMNDDNWYFVRNTRGVTGFLGGKKPIPLTDTEINNLGVNAAKVKSDFSIGDVIVVTSGIFENKIGKITRINESKQEVTFKTEDADSFSGASITVSLLSIRHM